MVSKARNVTTSILCNIQKRASSSDYYSLRACRCGGEMQAIQSCCFLMIRPPRYWAVYRIYIYPTNLNHGFVQCLICTPAARGAKVPIPHTMLCRTSLITATQRIFFLYCSWRSWRSARRSFRSARQSFRSALPLAPPQIKHCL